jgi:DNA-binding CsgD family transcriptional regulator
MERISDMQSNLGRAAYARGEIDQAFALFSAALALGREIDDGYAIGHGLNTLALVMVDRGEYASASGLLQEGLATWLELGSKDGIANALSGVATLAAAQRQWEVAARLFGAVSAMQVLVGPESRMEYRRHLQAERQGEELGGNAFSSARLAGSRLRHEDAIVAAVAYLTDVTNAPPPAPDTGDLRFGLTARERDVLRLLGEGRSDREIAEMLYLGIRTVEAHVRSIRGKLGVTSRNAAVAMAIREALL